MAKFLSVYFEFGGNVLADRQTIPTTQTPHFSACSLYSLREFLRGLIVIMLLGPGAKQFQLPPISSIIGITRILTASMSDG